MRSPRILLIFALVLIVVGVAFMVRRQRVAVKYSARAQAGRLVAAGEVERLLKAEVGGYRKVHVFVALCDNRHQGIAPVPAGIGNGQDAGSNLYWGARYGVKTVFSRSSAWTRVAVQVKPFAPVLERVVFRHKTKKVLLVADAYDGAYMREAVTAMLQSVAGADADPVVVNGQTYLFGGGAQLLVFVGHNGLMDLRLDSTSPANNTRQREAMLFACQSRVYFIPLLKTAGATPLLTTNTNMCPEAYTLEAALAGWANRESLASIHTRAAQAYSQHQRCSVRAAKGLFHAGW